MSPYNGSPMTLGNAAAARVRLIVWCLDCRHQVEPNPAAMAERYGAEMSVPDWHKRLVCGPCGSRRVDFVVTGERRAASIASTRLPFLRVGSFGVLPASTAAANSCTWRLRHHALPFHRGQNASTRRRRVTARLGRPSDTARGRKLNIQRVRGFNDYFAGIGDQDAARSGACGGSVARPSNPAMIRCLRLASGSKAKNPSAAPSNVIDLGSGTELCSQKPAMVH